MLRNINRHRARANCQVHSDALTRQRFSICAGIFLSAVVAGGCQPRPQWDLAPVEGSVTRAGQPLVGAVVTFWPDAGGKGPRASGLTNESGQYELKTDAGGLGAAPGAYRICVVVPRDERETEEELRQRFAARKAKDRKSTPASQAKTEVDAAEDSSVLPKEYSQFEKTPLRAEVKPGGKQTIDFNIP